MGYASNKTFHALLQIKGRQSIREIASKGTIENGWNNAVLFFTMCANILFALLVFLAKVLITIL